MDDLQIPPSSSLFGFTQSSAQQGPSLGDLIQNMPSNSALFGTVHQDRFVREQSVPQYLDSMLKSEMPWDAIAPRIKESFGVDPEPYRQSYRLAERKALLKGEGIGTFEQLGRRGLPFASPVLRQVQAKRYTDALAKFKEGKASEEDLGTIAEYEHRQDIDRQMSQSFGGKLVGALGGAGEIIGEASGAGAIAGRVPGLAGAATRAGQAAQFAGRQAVATPLMPSLYQEHVAQTNIEQGRDANDPRALPTALGLAYAQNLVLGQLQGKAAGSLIGRIPAAAKAGAIGVGESAAVDVAAGVADEFLPDAFKTRTRYGTLGTLARGERGEAVQHAAVGWLTFSAFAHMHGGEQAGKQTFEAGKQAFEDAASKGQPAPQAAAAAVEAAKQASAEALAPKPAEGEKPASSQTLGTEKTGSPLEGLSNEEVTALARGIGLTAKALRQAEGQPWVKALVDAFRGEKPPEAPQSRPEPAEPPVAPEPSPAAERPAGGPVGDGLAEWYKRVGVEPFDPQKGFEMGGAHVATDPLRKVADAFGGKSLMGEELYLSLGEMGMGQQAAERLVKDGVLKRVGRLYTIGEGKQPEGRQPAGERPASEPVGGERTAGEPPAGPPARERFVPALEVSLERMREKLRKKGQSKQAVEDAVAIAREEGLHAPDAVTGYQDARVGTLRPDTAQLAIDHVAKTGEPGVYVELDLHNLGGLNKKLGQSGADEVYAGMAKIIHQEMQRTGADVSLFRHGGDEMSAVIVNGTKQQVTEAMRRAHARIAELAASKGLTNIEHTKLDEKGQRRRGGTGVHFGVSEIQKGDTPKELFARADKEVAARKDSYGASSQSLETDPVKKALHQWTELKRDKKTAEATKLATVLKKAGLKQMPGNEGKSVVRIDPEQHEVLNTGGRRSIGVLVRRGWVDAEGKVVQKGLVEAHAQNQDDKSAHYHTYIKPMREDLAEQILKENPDLELKPTEVEKEVNRRVIRLLEQEAPQEFNHVKEQARRAGADPSAVEAALHEVAQEADAEARQAVQDEVGLGDAAEPAEGDSKFGFGALAHTVDAGPTRDPEVGARRVPDSAGEPRRGVGEPPLRPEERRDIGGGEPTAGERPAAGGKPNETALANAKVDQERVERGLPPILAEARKENEKVWDEAMLLLDRDERAAIRLVDELADNPRATTTLENALLLHQRVALSNEHQRAVHKAIDLFVKKDLPAFDRASAREADLLAQIDRLDGVIRRAGTEWGRAGQFRRQLVREDYSLSSMLLRAQHAKGAPLTDAEKNKIAELQAEIDRLQKALDAAESGKPASGGQAGGEPDVAGLRIKVKKAKTQFANIVDDMRISQLPVHRKALIAAGEAFNAMRALVASFDLPPLFRQGGAVFWTRPLLALKSLPVGLRATFSREAFERHVDEVNQRRAENPLYDRAGLHISDESGLLNKQEEGYIGRWEHYLYGTVGNESAGKTAALAIPRLVGRGVQASGRGYTSFLNELRMNFFDTLAGGLSINGRPDLAEAKVIANAVNVATGRGNLGSLEKHAALMTHLFFSPRYMVSRFQLLVGQPLMGGTLRTKAIIAKEYARALIGLATMYGMVSMATDDKNVLTFDPRSTDFGKIRIGNTRLDPLSGLSQVAVFLARMMKGEKVTEGGSLVDLRGSKVPFGGDSTGDVFVRFLQGKAAPVPGAVMDFLLGKTAVGKPTTASGLAGRLLLPMSPQDVYEALMDQGVPRGAAISLLAILGMGAQTYEQRKAK